MIPLVIGLASLAAAGMSDAERRRIVVQAALGSWKALFESIHPFRYVELVQGLTGDTRDEAARVFRGELWSAVHDGHGSHGSKDDAIKEAKSFISLWEGRWIPVISSLPPQARTSRVRAAGFDAQGRYTRGRIKDMDFPHAMMIRLGDGDIDKDWASKVEVAFEVDELEGPLPDQGSNDLIWKDMFVVGPEFWYWPENT